MNGKILGWDFSLNRSAESSEKLSADGSTTRDSISEEKTKLEDRIIAIPKIVALLTAGIVSMQSDYDWLSSLSSSHQKSWEKDHGEHPHVAAARILKKIGADKATINALNAEKAQIPGKIELLTKQLNALVEGESSGLSKGLDQQTAQALGEIELKKETAAMEHEAQLREIDLQNAQAQAEQNRVLAEGEKSSQTKWVIGISVVVVIAILSYILYKRNLAKAIIKPLAT